MYLKRLEISGFKSFAKPTKLEFLREISVIVGPNGSGKSNIVEAVKWVLGEQSIKSLRGKKGEDLIFNGSQKFPRLGKASVSIVFDNRGKIFPLDFEEVVITRKVYRDGTNEYFINNSKSRFKDVVEVLGKADLGTSSHYIISQGESDKILNVSLKERREMIEDALGLKIYQIKKAEAERKLLKTKENIREVENLRKEIQPHLRFLKKQVKKSEEALLIKEELSGLYKEYILNERRRLKRAEEEIEKVSAPLEKKIRELERELAQQDRSSVKMIEKEKERLEAESLDLKKKLSEIYGRRNHLEREIGRLEGMAEAERSRGRLSQEKAVAYSKVRKFLDELLERIEKAYELEEIGRIREALAEIKSFAYDFFYSEKETALEAEEGKRLEELERQIKSSLAEIERLAEEEAALSKELAEKNKIISEKEEEIRRMERSGYEKEMELKELERALAEQSYKKAALEEERRRLEEAIREAEALGAAIEDKDYSELEAPEWSKERERVWREIERLRIKLEESGQVSEEIIREYEEIKKRDEFFENELEDLNKALSSLKELLKELDEKINTTFKEGIKKINSEFQRFFSSMFDGGRAELKVVGYRSKKRPRGLEEEGDLDDEDEEGEAVYEEGVEVVVNLPRKRINSLNMLSGGERALTSIALLFAMSQVNPPPFLILDETDAALDESNSRRYGLMIKELSKHTQLIIVTHNRETMRQAGVIYGVTMGSEGISRLLSIKFSEAEKYTE